MRIDTTSDIRGLLEENIKLSTEILRSTERTRKYMRWAQAMAFIRVLIIVIPLILAVLYIPPFLSQLNKIFGNLYGGDQSNILNQLKNLNGGGLDLKVIEDLLGGQKK